MRLAHGCTSWALAAASSFGLALSSMAQQASKPAGEPAGRSETAKADCDVPPAQARLAEIQVELAWLGDAATFPCQLAARKVGGKLEVGGFVPNEILRGRAIDLARSNSELPVVDKVVVHPGSAVPSAKATHDELSKAAAAVLGRALAQHAEDFQFETDGNGQITVRGLIPTWEDKLTISRRLSQLPGCTCVTNQFRVRNQMRDGLVCNLVSTDGKLRVPAAPTAMVDVPAPKPVALPEVVQRIETPHMVPLMPTEAGPVLTAPAQQPAKPILAAVARKLGVDAPPPPVWPTAPVSAPATTRVVVPSVTTVKEVAPVRMPVPATAAVVSAAVASVPAAQPMSFKEVKPAGASPASPYIMQAAGAKPAASVKPVSYEAPGQQVREKTVASNAATRTVSSPYGTGTVMGGTPYGASPYSGTAPAATAVSAPMAPQVQAVVSSAPVALQPMTVVNSAPARPMSPLPVVSSPAIVQASYTTPATPTPTVPATTTAKLAGSAPVAQLAAVPPATPTPARGWTTPTTGPAPRIEYQAPGVLPANFVSTPMPILPPAQPVARPAATPAVAPMVTPVSASGIQPVSATVPAPLPAGQPPVAGPMPTGPVSAPEVQKALFQRIQNLGGAKVHDIRIQSHGSNDCIIHVTVRNAADGQEVGKKIIDMPELTPYKVDLQVHTSK